MLLIVTMAASSQDLSKELMSKAKKGDIEAQLNLSKFYIENSENEKASKWLYSAAKSGNKEAEELLYSFYSKELEKYAKEGNAEAQFRTGKYYHKGEGVKENPKKAAVWYDLAASQNHALARESLGTYYNKQLEGRAINNNEPDMQYYLGLCYFNGKGININKEIAAALFEQAMLQGHEKAGEYFFENESNLRGQRIKTVNLGNGFECTGYVAANSSVIDKSLVAEVTYGQGVLRFKGRKDGDNYYDANFESSVPYMTFQGDITLRDGVLTFHQGGKMQYTINKSKTELDKNYILPSDFVLDLGTGNIDAESIPMPNTKLTAALVDELKFANENNIRKAFELTGAPYLYVDLHVVPFNFECAVEMGIPEQSDSTSSIGSRLYMLNEGNFMILGENGFDKIIYSANQDKIEVFSKNYEDGVVNFLPLENGQANPKSNVFFTDGENFKGAYHLEKLMTSGEYSQRKDIEKIWNSKKISDLRFVMIAGDYTTSKGITEKWEGALPGDYKEYLENKKTEVETEKINKRFEKMAIAKEAAKKQLIEEGFNKSDVLVLLDRCEIRKGMSMRLIQRANDLKANLHIENDYTVDGWKSRQLIMIYSTDTQELIFHQFVGYNILGEVSAIGL